MNYINKRTRLFLYLALFVVFILVAVFVSEGRTGELLITGLFSSEGEEKEGKKEEIEKSSEKDELNNSDKIHNEASVEKEHLKNTKNINAREVNEYDEEKLDEHENDNKGDEQQTLSPKEWEKEDIIKNLKHFTSPIEGAKITRREAQLPSAPRRYRNGIHEGVDYYNGHVGVTIEMNTPVLAVADGTVIRADHEFEELTPERHKQILAEAKEKEITPEDTLDKLRGKQVWIEHEEGIITRYAHLYSIQEDIVEGKEVKKGQHIAGVGNSGTGDGVRGTNAGAHLHFEIWLTEDIYVGKNMEPMEAREILVEIFAD